MTEVSLAELVQSLESGSRPKGGVTTTSGEVPSLGGEHLSKEGGFRLQNLKLIPRVFYESMRSGKIQTGDILVVKDGATTGRTSFVSDGFPFDEAAVNEHVFCLRIASDKASPKFVFHYLRSHAGQTGIQADFRGATVGGISREFVSKIRVPNFSLSEQCRIAAVLDHADALIAKRREALVLLDRLAESTFLEMFGDPVTNPKQWPVQRLASLGSVVTGNTPPRADATNYGNAIEWIKSDNLNTPHYYVTRAEEMLSEIGMKRGRTAPPNSVLVTCIAGSPDCIGNAALTDRTVAFNQQINAFIPTMGDAHFYYAQIRVGKRLIQAASTQGMKGLVTKGRFEKVELIVPPADLQRQFANVALTIQSQAKAQGASLKALEQLKTSLQYRAFLGEL